MNEFNNDIFNSDEYNKLFLTSSNELTPLGTFVSLCLGFAICCKVANIALNYASQLIDDSSDEDL